jgi:hypothetical protein
VMTRTEKSGEKNLSKQLMKVQEQKVLCHERAIYEEPYPNTRDVGTWSQQSHLHHDCQFSKKEVCPKRMSKY